MIPAHPSATRSCARSTGSARRNTGAGTCQAIFSGEAGDAPKTLASTNGVLRFVFNVPGAIGYVRASEVDPSVKMLRVDGRLPGEPGYRLEVGAQ